MPRLLLLLFLVVSACGTPPQASPPILTTTSSPPPVDACPTGVEYAVHGQDAAMGLRVLGLRLTNCGTETLTLDGYPSVTVLGADHEPLTIAVVPGSAGIAGGVPAFDAEPRPVVVAPGESATTGLVWRNTYTDVSAPPVVGAHLEIAVAAGRPVREFTPVDESGDPVTIDLGSTGKLGLRPWTTP